MNKKIVLSVIVIIIFSAAFILHKSPTIQSKLTAIKESTPSAHATYTKIPNLDKLKSGSDIVVEVNVTKDKKTKDYKGIPVTITTVKVNEVIKGTLDIDKLNILQDSQADVTIKNGQRLLMFLRKGKDNPDCYIPVGGGQGIYEIKNANTNNKFGLSSRSNDNELQLYPQSLENEDILKDLKGNYSDIKSKLKN